jgi:hypothetical protein
MNCVWTLGILVSIGTQLSMGQAEPCSWRMTAAAPWDISKSEVHGELLVEIFAVASVGFHSDQ